MAVDPRSPIYDALYEEAHKIQAQGNPCNIRQENGRMVCNANLEACCYGCKHLTPTGCGVQALSCKLWLCDTVKYNPCNAPVVISLTALRRVGNALGIPTEPYGQGARASKEEALGGR